MIIETHAFGNYVPSGAETLIVGTFPTHERNREFDFYYPNKNNVFWRIIGDLFDYTFKHKKGADAAEERKVIASAEKIALTDMLAKAIRTKNNSGDNQLVKVEITDILSIIQQCPTIRRVILTSRSGKLNALNLFREYLKERNITFYKERMENIIVGFFEHEQKKVNVFVPYSPSPRVERQYGFELIRGMYQKCFEN